MTLLTLQQRMDVLCCPSCSAGLKLTKEKILFCPVCFLGFRVCGEVPDLRLSQAIHFKKKATEGKKGCHALFTTVIGVGEGHSFEVGLGRCVIIGRAKPAEGELDTDQTCMISREGLQSQNLDSKTQELIEKYLTPVRAEELKKSNLSLLRPGESLCGLTREPDVYLDDKSVSKAHALLYQDESGVWVLDLVSKNGTFVNGAEVERAQLKNNDVLSLGMASLRVRFL